MPHSDDSKINPTPADELLFQYFRKLEDEMLVSIFGEAALKTDMPIKVLRRQNGISVDEMYREIFRKYCDLTGATSKSLTLEELERFVLLREYTGDQNDPKIAPDVLSKKFPAIYPALCASASFHKKDIRPTSISIQDYLQSTIGNALIAGERLKGMNWSVMATPDSYSEDTWRPENLIRTEDNSSCGSIWTTIDKDPKTHPNFGALDELEGDLIRIATILMNRIDEAQALENWRGIRRKELIQKLNICDLGSPKNSGGLTVM